MWRNGSFSDIFCTQMKQQTYQAALIDDDCEFAERIVDYYASRKINFRHFENPEAFLSEVRSYTHDKVPYDLVLTDLLMPEMSGIEFTQKLKALHPDLPVIFMTADTAVDTAIHAIEAGANDYIIKPPNFPHLTIILQKTLHFSQLQHENAVLRKTIDEVVGWSSSIVAKSPVLLKAIELSKRVAASDATVLIVGESGTGKEVFAQLIHTSSPRAKKPFIAINCSAIPENLLESELFGHSKGSFTGAESARVGLFEEANGGTLFLDEIGDMPIALQAKLLRVLQERKIKRIGENVEREVDVRIVAATLKNLGEEVKNKKFREDLFYRLNVIPIMLPSLKERKEDILPLAGHFLEKFSNKYRRGVKKMSREAAEWLLNCPWKGNVRELENALERAVVIAAGDIIELDDLRLQSFANGIVENASVSQAAVGGGTLTLLNSNEASSDDNLLKQFEVASSNDSGRVVELVKSSASHPVASEQPQANHLDSAKPAEQSEVHAKGKVDESGTFLDILKRPITLEELELRYIDEVLASCGGVKDRAAKTLGIDRKTLYRKLQAKTDPQPQSLHT